MEAGCQGLGLQDLRVHLSATKVPGATCLLCHSSQTRQSVVVRPCTQSKRDSPEAVCTGCRLTTPSYSWLKNLGHDGGSKPSRSVLLRHVGFSIGSHIVGVSLNPKSQGPSHAVRLFRI